ncbi:MAG: ABC transporter ATP-binding protein [Granulosicoccaceae bacterium]
MLSLNNIEVAYDKVQVLFDVSFDVKAGEILCLLGRNGAGKTTALKSIMGLLPLKSGRIQCDNQTLSTLPPFEVPKQGIAYVPQGRGLFSELTVAQNIEIGLMVKGSGPNTRERVLDMFPRLRERLKQRAETLSGGEQQMLAMARALSMEPKLLLLDEPTEGLQPSIIALIQEVIIKMKEQGVAIVLVEHHINTVLSIADRVAFIENGRCPEIADIVKLRDDQQIVHRYLGIN